MTTEHLRFSPDILRRLGEELVPHLDQSIIELVRNAYDADAVTCQVELFDTENLGGTLRVTDDGVGMTAEAIRDGWLVLGRSAKAGHRLTRFGRTAVGDKGLGRLAALRMGAEAELRTRPIDEPGTEYCLVFEWPRFDSASVVEDVDLQVRTGRTDASHGTTIEVRDLSVRVTRREVERLARALLLLADPFDRSRGFRPVLVAPAFQDLEQRVRESYFPDAEFHLVAALDDQGYATAHVFDRNGVERWVATHNDSSKAPFEAATYQAPAATFNLWAFNLNPTALTPHTLPLGLRSWLREVNGVHLYHRGLRVHPYGDAGHDWLDMNLARARSPEQRPSTNTSLGQVVVPDPHERLVQKTDRSGFIENEAFGELRQFLKDALDWMANERLSEREARRAKERIEAPHLVAQAQASLARTIEQLSPDDRAPLQSAVRQLDTARDQEAKTLRDEVLLYRTLGTVGTTAAVFAHEAAKPVTQIEQMAKVIERRGRTALGDAAYSSLLENPVCHVLRSARALKSFAALPLRLLAREKRRSGRIDVHAVIRDVLQLFEPFLEDARIEDHVELVDGTPLVMGSVAAIETIIANLLTNSAQAFDSENVGSNKRDVVIHTGFAGEKRLALRVLDSGPGIDHISVEDIWLPGRTTRPGGTGLGLTIVRDTVADLGGTVRAVARGELGGAEFIVDLPLLPETGHGDR